MAICCNENYINYLADCMHNNMLSSFDSFEITYLIDKKCDVLVSELENVFLLPGVFCLCLLSLLHIYDQNIITEMEWGLFCKTSDDWQVLR